MAAQELEVGAPLGSIGDVLNARGHFQNSDVFGRVGFGAAGRCQ